MYFHPDDALTREELLHKIWNKDFTPALRAKVLAKAEARGCTWLDIMHELSDEHRRLMADPIERACILSDYERQAVPFGRDQRLEQDGAR